MQTYTEVQAQMADVFGASEVLDTDYPPEPRLRRALKVVGLKTRDAAVATGNGTKVAASATKHAAGAPVRRIQARMVTKVANRAFTEMGFKPSGDLVGDMRRLNSEIEKRMQDAARKHEQDQA